MITKGTKAQKGKDYKNLPDKTLAIFDAGEWCTSIKFDGMQIFINKSNGSVEFFTSDWKQFDLPEIRKQLEAMPEDNLTIVGEFLYACEGKLGDRGNSAILTTARTEFAKGIPSSVDETKVTIKAFDFVANSEHTFTERMVELGKLELPKQIQPIDFTIASGATAKELAKEAAKVGWEGLMCISPYSKYAQGKRVNHAVKLKARQSADLKCVGVERAEPGSQFDGLIGALVLQDSTGRIARVGSGLTPEERKANQEEYVGKIIEINYEQILDTYIQPTFVSVRTDKTESD